MSIWDESISKHVVQTKKQYDLEQKQRKAWFDKIKPHENWRLPIDTVIDKKDFNDCLMAAEWFTGGPSRWWGSCLMAESACVARATIRT